MTFPSSSKFHTSGGKREKGKTTPCSLINSLPRAAQPHPLLAAAGALMDPRGFAMNFPLVHRTHGLCK